MGKRVPQSNHENEIKEIKREEKISQKIPYSLINTLSLDS